MPVTEHPAAAALAAFALGKLDEAAADAISRHLDTCDVCRSTLEHTPRDTFVSLLRGAAKASPMTSTPSRSLSATRGPAPAAIAPDELPPELRDHPRYRVVQRLGQGGMGVVYRAEHKMMERLVVIKVINRALVDSPDAVERFDREVRAAAKLDHPNIVKAHDAEEAGGLQLLVMEYVEGKNLADVLHKKGPLPVAYACQCVRQAALGLQHAHEKGMVHRDVKPQNLMLTPKGVVKILDFGLAKLASERQKGPGLTAANVAMGTPAYIAPEQALDTANADIRADVYALGCTLFELLTGRTPFVGDQPMPVILAHVNDPPPPLEKMRPDVPTGLAELVARMLAKKPADRPQTPKDVAEALLPFTKAGTQAKAAAPVKTVAESESPWAGVTAERPAVKRSAKRPPWLPAAVAAGLLLAVGVVAGIVLWVKVPGGVVRLEVDPPDAKVEVADEGKMTVTPPNGGEPWKIGLAAEKGWLKISKAGFEVKTQEVTLSEKGTTIKVLLEPVIAPKRKPEETPIALAVPPPAKPEPQPAATVVKANDGFVPLFNGKDVTGWQVSPNIGTWSIENGLLIGKGGGAGQGKPAVIKTKRNDFANFRLRLELRNADGNSTEVNVRSSLVNENHSCYHISTGGGNGLGSVIPVGSIGKSENVSSRSVIRWDVRAASVPLRMDDWFVMEIAAINDTIQVMVNDHLISSLEDRSFKVGQIELACRSAAYKEFRKIEIKELP